MNAHAEHGPWSIVDCELDGHDLSSSPGLFAAAESSIWQEGQACHSKYVMACMGQPGEPSRCRDVGVVVEIIQECQHPCSADFLLTSEAFSQISSAAAGYVIVIGYQQVE